MRPKLTIDTILALQCDTETLREHKVEFGRLDRPLKARIKQSEGYPTIQLELSNNMICLISDKNYDIFKRRKSRTRHLYRNV